MVGTLFLMIIFFFKIETVHVWNRATCFRHYMKFPPYDNYCVLTCWDLGSTR